MKRFSIALALAAALSPLASAQTPAMYTGCIEAVNHDGMFLLTRAASPAGRMDRRDDPMTATAFLLAGSKSIRKHVGQTVSIAGSVTDAPAESLRRDLRVLTVKSLKVVARSCSASR
jgi:hypothetical protein